MKAFLFPLIAPALLCTALLTATFPASAADELFDDPEFGRAVAAYAENRLDDAKLAFENLTQRFPDDPSLLNNLAVIAMKQGDTEYAIALLKRAIETDAVINTGYRNLSSIYTHMASLSYRDALSLESVDPKPPQLNLIKTPDPTPLAEVAEATVPIVQAEEIDIPLVRDPEAPAPSVQDRSAADALDRWAQAWEEQDTDTYFASYASGYKPPRGSYRDWRQQRTARVMAPRRIKVNLTEVRVQMNGDDDAHLTFRQNYSSDLLSSSVLKRMRMRKIDDEWKITSERVF